MFGHVDVVRYLVERGATLDAKDEVRLDMDNITLHRLAVVASENRVIGLIRQIYNSTALYCG